MLADLDIQSRLDAMEGVAYLTSLNGVLVAYGRKNWDRFAHENQAEELALPENVCGRHLSSFITGSLTRATHEAAARMVLKGRSRLITYSYRCDAPDLRRDMQMTISVMERNSERIGLLYHSVCLRETPQEPLGFLERDTSSLPSEAKVLRVCSYCRSVRYPPDAEESVWMTPEQYRALGGGTKMTLSHGICPDCWTNIAEPMLAQIQTESQ
jgi:hypothetical protein